MVEENPQDIDINTLVSLSIKDLNKQLRGMSRSEVRILPNSNTF